MSAHCILVQTRQSVKQGSDSAHSQVTSACGGSMKRSAKPDTSVNSRNRAQAVRDADPDPKLLGLEIERSAASTADA